MRPTTLRQWSSQSSYYPVRAADHWRWRLLAIIQDLRAYAGVDPYDIEEHNLDVHVPLKYISNNVRITQDPLRRCTLSGCTTTNDR
jgi:hypothetical protein